MTKNKIKIKRKSKSMNKMKNKKNIKVEYIANNLLGCFTLFGFSTFSITLKRVSISAKNPSSTVILFTCLLSITLIKVSLLIIMIFSIVLIYYIYKIVIQNLLISFTNNNNNIC
ncbi:hypothetical protein H8356DRAFT_1083644 [Neocallimastix lanati (nom. inval.)]|nr:hypothetical protein H8356DRAFT_1083644 [Neocallimastix sp. JGI-2020a]